MKYEIIPAILSHTYEDLHEHLARVDGIAPMVQIDVCDGAYTPSKTWPYMKGPRKEYEKHFMSFVDQSEGFPFWESISIEADLMVADPETVASEWISAGAERVIVHFESATPELVARSLSLITERGADAGIAVNPSTPPHEASVFISNNLSNIAFVQCMGIDKEGFQHQRLDTAVFDMISTIRSQFPDLSISVDGGVTLDNASQLLDAGANRLVAGSAIFDGALSEGLSTADTIQAFEDILYNEENDGQDYNNESEDR